MALRLLAITANVGTDYLQLMPGTAFGHARLIYTHKEFQERKLVYHVGFFLTVEAPDDLRMNGEQVTEALGASIVEAFEEARRKHNDWAFNSSPIDKEDQTERLIYDKLETPAVRIYSIEYRAGGDGANDAGWGYSYVDEDNL